MNELFMTLMWWVGTILGLLGAWLVGEHNKKGFIVWMVANPITIFQMTVTSNWNMVFQFVIYFILALRGWTKKSKT